MLTHSSPELTSTTWSPVMARPRWPVTLSTPGTERSSWLARGDDARHLRARRARRRGQARTTSRSLKDGITRAVHRRDQRDRGQDSDGGAGHDPARPRDEAREQAPVASVGRSRGVRVRPAGRRLHQQRSERGRDGERDHHRRHHRERIGAYEGREERAGHALDEEHGHRGEQEDATWRSRAGRAGAGGLDDRPASPADVLGVDDGVVDHRAEGDARGPRRRAR